MENKILEQIIDENIPRELLNAYKTRSYTSYDSETHPETIHYELGRRDRRSKKWSYGKASYEKISVDDALALINQDPHNVEKLRGIRNGKLVEYEYKNGKFYNIYADPDDPVEYVDRRGNTIAKRNIRYITNPKIWLPLLDVIYLTDEYDHYIGDTLDARSEKSELGSVHSFVSRGSDTYDRYRPAYSHVKNPLYIGQKSPDTGDHDISYLTAMKNSYYRDGFTDSSVSLPDTLKVKIAEYINLKKETKKLYNDYDIARRALKKLEREKDDYDEEEYTEIKERWTSRLKELLDRYNEAMRNLRNLEVKVTKHMNSVQDATNNKLMDMFVKYENLIKQFTELKNQLGRMKTKAVTNVVRDVNKYSRSDIEKQIMNLASAIVAEIQTLKEVEAKIRELADSDSDYSDESDKLDTLISEIDRKSAELSEVKKAYIKEHIKKYRQLETNFNEIKASIDELRPHDAARAASRKLAAGEAELDPELDALISFTDFDVDDDPESNQETA